MLRKSRARAAARARGKSPSRRKGNKSPSRSSARRADKSPSRSSAVRSPSPSASASSRSAVSSGSLRSASPRARVRHPSRVFPRAPQPARVASAPSRASPSPSSPSARSPQARHRRAATSASVSPPARHRRAATAASPAPPAPPPARLRQQRRGQRGSRGRRQRPLDDGGVASDDAMAGSDSSSEDGGGGGSPRGVPRARRRGSSREVASDDDEELRMRRRKEKGGGEWGDSSSSSSDSDSSGDDGDDGLDSYDLTRPPPGYEPASDPFLAMFGHSEGDQGEAAPALRAMAAGGRRGRRPSLAGGGPDDNSHDARPTVSKLSLHRRGNSSGSLRGGRDEAAAARAFASASTTRAMLKDFKFPSLRRHRTVETDRAHTESGGGAGGFRRVNQYLVLRSIGQGAFGRVRLAFNTRNGRYYALKSMSKSRLQRKRVLAGRGGGGRKASVVSREWEAVKEEIAVSKRLLHPSVVRLMEVIDDTRRDHLYLVMELVEGGPVMRDGGWRRVPHDLARGYFRDLLEGLAYLHAEGVAHRDVKPANLLVTHDGRLKIADFGVATATTGGSSARVMTAAAGTTAFMAPEVFTDKHSGGAPVSGRKVDVWAAGVTLYAMMFARLPFRGADKFAVEHQIREKKLKLPLRTSSKLAALLRGLLDKDPRTRLGVDEALAHPWMKKK